MYTKKALKNRLTGKNVIGRDCYTLEELTSILFAVVVNWGQLLAAQKFPDSFLRNYFVKIFQSI